MHSLVKSKAYKKFVIERNQALESILHKAQLKTTDVLNGAFNDVLFLIKKNYNSILKYPAFITTLDQELKKIFSKALFDIDSIYRKMRHDTYLMTTKSEQEAISRGLDKKINYKALNAKAYAQKEDEENGSIHQRLDYGLGKQKNKIIDAVKYSIMKSENDSQVIQRVFKTLPRFQKIDKRKILHKVREAEYKPPIDFGFIDDFEWQQLVDDYLSEYIPINRSPESFFDVETAGGYRGYDENVVYSWEIEKDMTNDFVQAVRAGQVDAAKSQGITDFVVIAVVDDKTCSNCCGSNGCIDFDGKTTKEVERMTKGAQSAPPYHFNCRCDLAPFTEEMPDVEPSNLEDFKTWLNS